MNKNTILIALIGIITVATIGVIASKAYEFISNKKFWADQKREAIVRFNKTRISSLKPEEAQGFIDAITGESGWKITYENVKFKETGYSENPYIAVETSLLKNQDDSKNILIDKLYIYDDDSLQWIPISERKDLFIGNKITETEKTDIWSGGNNWVKAYFKGDEEKSDPNWDKCASIVLAEDFDMETDLPENHECYKTQQDFQELFSLIDHYFKDK